MEKTALNLGKYTFSDPFADWSSNNNNTALKLAKK